MADSPDLSNKADLDAAIAAKPGVKVTKKYMECRISSVSYLNPVNAPTLTICVIVLDNGFSVQGVSACVDPANFDPKIGNQLAYNDAFSKLWPLFGFLLAEFRYDPGFGDTVAEFASRD